MNHNVDMAVELRSTARAVLTITAEYSLIAGAVVFSVLSDWQWGYIVALLIIGTRQYALGEALAHEASHWHLVARPKQAGAFAQADWHQREAFARKCNDLLGVFLTWPFFMTLSAYRRHHNRQHHNIDLDSEENSIWEEYEDWGLPEPEALVTRARLYWLLALKPFTGLIGVDHVRKTLTDAFVYDRDLLETRLMICTWSVLLLAGAWAGLLHIVVWYWIVPQILISPVLNYWSEIGDHYRVTGGRTRSDINWLLNRLVSHNIGYHALHHADPSIPWFALPTSYAARAPELEEQVSSGYLDTLRQILAYKPEGGRS